MELEQLLDALARDVLHLDERGVLDQLGIIDPDHVRMIQSVHDAGFALEARPHLLIQGDPGADQFQRAIGIEPQVPDQPDSPHAPLAELPLHEVAIEEDLTRLKVFGCDERKTGVRPGCSVPRGDIARDTEARRGGRDRGGSISPRPDIPWGKNGGRNQCGLIVLRIRLDPGVAEIIRRWGLFRDRAGLIDGLGKQGVAIRGCVRSLFHPGSTFERAQGHSRQLRP
jgi:hypothetical protein